MKVCKNCRRPAVLGTGKAIWLHQDGTYYCNPGSRAYECEPVEESALQPSRRPDYVYVASSWRCEMQVAVVHVLAAAGIAHYDFRNPVEPNTCRQVPGFSWKDVMPSFDINNQLVDKQEYLAGLDHALAVQGYESDMRAMLRADCFVLVLPCGRSAHLELGWAVGQGKKTAILLDGPQVTPELMYKMVDYIATDVHDLLGWLGVED